MGGETTSVYAIDGYVVVVVDTSDGNFTNPSGHVSVLDASSFEEIRRIDLGGQPDSIDVYGTTAVIAMENQRDEDAMNDLGTGKKGDLPKPRPANWQSSASTASPLPGSSPPSISRAWRAWRSRRIPSPNM